MIKYSDRAAVNWSGLDVEYHLCDVVDLKVKDEEGLNKYLHEVMDDQICNINNKHLSKGIFYFFKDCSD